MTIFVSKQGYFMTMFVTEYGCLAFSLSTEKTLLRLAQRACPFHQSFFPRHVRLHNHKMFDENISHRENLKTQPQVFNLTISDQK